jgi:hypothetical protein
LHDYLYSTTVCTTTVYNYITGKNMNPHHAIQSYQANTQIQHNIDSVGANKWTYLIANSIKFSAKSTNAIKLTKPTADLLFIWIEKIINAGQCQVLFIENLDLGDFRSQEIKQLCELNGITLVNLTVDTPLPNNVLVGPWH